MIPAISTVDLSHSFPSQRGPVHALRGVSLQVAPGEFFGMFGPNGAGKTTLIRILTTLVIPSGGKAEVHGHDVVREPGRVRALVGLVYSNENSFYGRLTGQQNLEFFAALQNLGRKEGLHRIAELLELFDLTRAAHAPFQSYSTGMRQKMNVARALLHNPPVIFLDEPTKGMDVLTAETLRRLLRNELVERQRKTVILTTHDLEEMEALCDRVGILEAGRLSAVGTPADLIREASATVVYRLELTGVANGLVEELQGLPAVQSLAVVSRANSSLVVDLVLSETAAPEAEVWEALVQRQVKVRRYGPKEDGLVSLLKQASSDSRMEEESDEGEGIAP